MLKLLELARKALTSGGKAAGSALAPANQIKQVGSKRVWLTLALSFVLPVVIYLLHRAGISQEIIRIWLMIVGGSGLSFVTLDSVKKIVDKVKEKQ